jgi:hypothetical protein
LQLVSGYNINGTDYYASIFEKTGGPAWEARHGMESGLYQTEFDNWTKKGFRLTLVSGYSAPQGPPHFAAIWQKKSGPAWYARHGMSSTQYQQEFDQANQKGYRLTWVSGYGVGGQAYYAAIFEKKTGPAYVARHGLTSKEYQTVFDQLTKQGYRLLLVDGYTVNGQDLYAAIFEMSKGPVYVTHHGMTSTDYQTKFNQYVSQGYRLTLVSGYGDKEARYAAIWTK